MCLRPADSKTEPLSFLTSSNYYKQLNLLDMILKSFSDFFQFCQILENFSHTNSHTALVVCHVYR